MKRLKRKELRTLVEAALEEFSYARMQNLQHELVNHVEALLDLCDEIDAEADLMGDPEMSATVRNDPAGGTDQIRTHAGKIRRAARSMARGFDELAQYHTQEDTY